MSCFLSLFFHFCLNPIASLFKFYPFPSWWRYWRSIVVRTSVLAGGLSLSCAILMDVCLTTLWVRRPLSVNQQGQLSLPSLRGRLNEFRNPLYGLRKVGTFVQLTGLPGRPVRHPVFAGCTRRLCDRRLWLVTKSALEVCIRTDALYKSHPLPHLSCFFKIQLMGSEERCKLSHWFLPAKKRFVAM